MERVYLPHLHEHPLDLCLFANLQNASFLRKQLLEGNTDYEYAFVDASILLSRNQVLSACFRAINDHINGRTKSRNVHSEIVFALSPNNNIAESFRRFGISDDTKNLLAIKVGSNFGQVEAHLRANIQGTPTTFSDDMIAMVHDPARIRKIYRLEAPKKGTDSTQLGKDAESYVLGSIALKGS